MGESDLKATTSNVLGTFSDFTRDDNYSSCSLTHNNRPEEEEKKEDKSSTTC